MNEQDVVIRESSYHRNGVGGLGFYAIRFMWHADDCEVPEEFLATLFDERGACAVICLDRIEKCGVGFAQGNSWRGDVFEPILRKKLFELTTQPALPNLLDQDDGCLK